MHLCIRNVIIKTTVYRFLSICRISCRLDNQILSNKHQTVVDPRTLMVEDGEHASYRWLGYVTHSRIQWRGQGEACSYRALNKGKETDRLWWRI